MSARPTQEAASAWSGGGIVDVGERVEEDWHGGGRGDRHAKLESSRAAHDPAEDEEVRPSHGAARHWALLGVVRYQGNRSERVEDTPLLRHMLLGRSVTQALRVHLHELEACCLRGAQPVGNSYVRTWDILV